MYEALDQWDFVVAAYAVGIAGTLGMVAWAWWDICLLYTSDAADE